MTNHTDPKPADEATTPVECIVIPNVDGPTLWDCLCAECRGLRLHAAWIDAG